ncbi:MAG: hypothetical protein IPN79_04545 [Saprospiraceae bacterium]|nr:hypothetical protein [Saprospiraceae bacterium]
MKKVKIIVLIFVSVFLLVAEADAQSRKKKKGAKSSSVDKETTVIVFGDEEEAEERNEKKRKLKMINIKTSPFSFVRGVQLLEIEKELTSVVSLQAGVGATFKGVLSLDSEFFSDILAFDEFEDGVYESSNFDTNRDISDFYNEDRVQKTGFAFTVSPRFFLDADGFEGQYLSPAYTYRQLNYETPSVVENSSQVVFDPSNFDKESKTISNLSVRYGVQYLFDSNITTDMFLGVGLRFVNESRQDLGYNNFGRVERQFHQIKSNGFLFEFGVRVGYYF